MTAPSLMPTPSHHTRDPLHRITLETIVSQLVAKHGWDAIAYRVPACIDDLINSLQRMVQG